MKKFLKAFAIALVILALLADMFIYSLNKIQFDFLKKNNISYVEYRFPNLYYTLYPKREKNRHYVRLLRIIPPYGRFYKGNINIVSFVKTLQMYGKNIEDYVDTILFFLDNGSSDYGIFKLTTNQEILTRFLNHYPHMSEERVYEILQYYHNDAQTTHFFLEQGIAAHKILSRQTLRRGTSSSIHKKIVQSIKAYRQEKNQEMKGFIKLRRNLNALNQNNANLRNIDNQNMLYFVNTLDNVKRLIKYRIDTSNRDINRTTPLMHFIELYNQTTTPTHKQEYYSIIKLLLKKGADRLGALSQARDLKLLKLLLKYNTNINETDRFKRNLLYYADNLKFMKFLIAHYIDINRHDKNDQTPLIYLLQQYNKTQNIEYKKMIQLLLQNGANVHNATFFTNNLEMIKLLFDNGANINETKDRTHGTTLLMHHQNHIPIRNFLLSKGIDITKEDNGNSILHLANDVEFIEYLLSKGLKLKGDRLIKLKWKSLFSLLSRYHQSIGKEKKRYFEVIQKLLKDANINAIDRFKQNLLFYANEPQLVQYLIERGINIDQSNRKGITPLKHFEKKYHQTENMKYHKIMQLLQKNDLKETKVEPTPKSKQPQKEPKRLIDCDTLEEVKKLVAQDKSLVYRDYQDEYQYITALDFFLKRYQQTKEEKYLKISRYLIASGAHPSVDKMNETLLSLLMTNETRKQFQAHLGQAVADSLTFTSDTNETSLLGLPPLSTKNRKKQLEVIKKLLKFDLNTSGLLFRTQDEEIATILLAHGADINERTPTGLTPLAYHLRNKYHFMSMYAYNPHFITFLREHGATISTYTPIYPVKDTLDFMTHYPGLSILVVGDTFYGIHFAIYPYLKDKFKTDANTMYEFNISSGMIPIVNEKLFIKPKETLPKVPQYTLSFFNIYMKIALEKQILDYIPNFQNNSFKEFEHEILYQLYEKYNTKDQKPPIKKCNQAGDTGLISIVNECGPFY